MISFSFLRHVIFLEWLPHLPCIFYKFSFVIFSRAPLDPPALQIGERDFLLFLVLPSALCSDLARLLSGAAAQLLPRDFPFCPLGLPLATFPWWTPCRLDQTAFCFLGPRLPFYQSIPSTAVSLIQTSHSLLDVELKVINMNYI